MINNIISQNITTFIIWKNARRDENYILNEISKIYSILKCYNVNWTPEKYGENLSAFYGDNFIYNMHQRNIRGEGEFIFIIAYDNNPIF